VVAATTFITSLRILLSDLNPLHLQHNPTSWTPPRSRSMCRLAGSRSTLERSVIFKDLVPLAGHDDSAASSAFSLGLHRHCDISSRCSSKRHLNSALAAMSTRPYGFLGHGKIYPKVHTHSGAVPRLFLCTVQGHGRHAARFLAPAWGSAGVSIGPRGGSAALRDSAPPNGHDDSAASSAPNDLTRSIHNLFQ